MTADDDCFKEKKEIIFRYRIDPPIFLWNECSDKNSRSIFYVCAFFPSRDQMEQNQLKTLYL
jgi:hypothetical protein